MQDAMRSLTSGIFILTSVFLGRHNGCVINTVTQVTAQPGRICFAVNKSNYTHEMLQQTGRFTISVLHEQADFSLIKRFGFQSGRTAEKFADFTGYRNMQNWTTCITEGTNAYLSGEVLQAVDCGTHTLFIGEVTESGVLCGIPSASYGYYQEHIKPKPEKIVTETGKTLWRCTICGYEHETPEGEELPEDFLCPLCKHPASDFEKVS